MSLVNIPMRSMLLGLVAALIGAGPALSEPLIVPRGASIAVRLPDDPTRTERFAARELQDYLGRLLDAQVRVNGGDDAALVVEVGRTDGNAPLLQRFDPAIIGPGPDSFAVVVEDGVVRLAGGSDRGTLYAVYAWLESLGCRWFMPGELGEVVPELEQIEVVETDQTHRPANITREIGGGPEPFDPYEYAQWCVRNRLNRKFAMREPLMRHRYPDRADVHHVWSERGGLRQWHWIAHNFAFMFPPEEDWFERRPDFFALYNGRRIPLGTPGKRWYGGGNLALTNPDVVAHCADFAIEWFNAHPAGTVVPMWPADGAIKWDESPEAMALGGQNFTAGPEGSMSRRMVTFVNAVARRVAAEHPDRLILLPAYANYLEPVPDLDIEPNIFVQYCYHGDYAHGPTQSPANADAAERMRVWASKAPGRFGVWEYFLIGDHTAQQPVPVLMPLVYRVRDTMRFLDDLGSTRYFTQSNNVYQKHNPLLYYAVARYAWDPSLDADALIDDFSLNMYGPSAGPHAAAFYKRLEQACQQSEWRPMVYSDVATPSPRVFTDEVNAELETALAAAEGAPMTPVQARRLALLREAFDYSRANARTQAFVGLDRDTPWRLERGLNAYLVNADAPDIDPRRFQELIQHTIDTGRATATFDRIVFRARKRAEPIIAIENDTLRAEVIPGLGGRLIRLIDKPTGHNFMMESPAGDTLDTVGAAYFNYGGYEEYIGRNFAGPGWETAFDHDVVRTRNGSAITVAADIDGLRLSRQYALPSGEEPSLTITSTLTNTTDQPRSTMLRTHPQFNLGGGLDRARVLIRTADGGVYESSPMAEHDGPTVQPHGAWALVHPDADRAVVHRFDPDAAKAYFFTDNQQRYGQMELFGEPAELAPGESLTIVQTIRVGDAQQGTQWLGADAPTPAPALSEPGAEGGSPTPIEPLSGRGAAAPGVVGQGAAVGEPGTPVYDGALLHPTAGTIELWARLPQDAAQTESGWLLSVGENNPEWCYLLIEKGKLTFLLKHGRKPYQNADDYYAVVSTDIDWKAGQWGHVAATWAKVGDDRGMLRLYVDGVLRESRDDVRIGTAFAAERIRLGGSSASSKLVSDVMLDELRISNRPRTAEEIAAGVQRVRQGEPLPADDATLLKLDMDGSFNGVNATRQRLSAEQIEQLVDETRRQP